MLAALKPKKKRRRKKKNRGKVIVPFYRALMLELECRRQATGISMEQMNELMGNAERSYAKMLHPETPSGRLARWPTIQKAIDVLFMDGFRLRIERSNDGPLTTAGTRERIHNSARFYDRRLFREHMSEIASVRARIIPPEKLSAIGRKAAKARWRKVRRDRHGLPSANGQRVGPVELKTR